MSAKANLAYTIPSKEEILCMFSVVTHAVLHSSDPEAKVDPVRATNDYKHVCPHCDSKKFAQSVGVKMRQIYKIDASSTQTL
jgi:hypothetical protein